MVETRPFLVNGEWRTGEGPSRCTARSTTASSPRSACPPRPTSRRRSPPHVHLRGVQKLPVWARAEALDHISKRLAETIEENAKLIAAEGGKPLKWATVEATRAASTFRWASEVIRHGDDELMRLDTEQAWARASASFAASRSARSWASRRSTSR